MNYVELEDITVVHSTDKAVLIDYDGTQLWIPFSQIEDNSEDLKKGFRGRIYITEWFAGKEGIA